MTPARFAKIALYAGLVLLPIFSPALTIPGLVMGLPKAAAGAILVACTLALSGRAGVNSERRSGPE